MKTSTAMQYQLQDRGPLSTPGVAVNNRMPSVCNTNSAQTRQRDHFAPFVCLKPRGVGDSAHCDDVTIINKSPSALTSKLTSMPVGRFAPEITSRGGRSHVLCRGNRRIKE